MVYVDSQGYRRWKDKKTLVHRSVAYNRIYIKDKKKYFCPFSEYQVHHIDKDITNNRVENLELIPIREHERRHKIIRYEYPVIYSLWIFLGVLFSWYIYIATASGYKFNGVGVIFMLTTTIIGGISLCFVNKKKKGWRYK